MSYTTEEWLDALEGYIDWLRELHQSALDQYCPVPVQGFPGYFEEYIHALRSAPYN